MNTSALEPTHLRPAVSLPEVDYLDYDVSGITSDSRELHAVMHEETVLKAAAKQLKARGLLQTCYAAMNTNIAIIRAMKENEEIFENQ